MNTGEAWPRCPRAATFFEEQFRVFADANPPLAEMAGRFLSGAGVDILALIDHWTLPRTPELIGELGACGLVETRTEDGDPVWEHPQARLPRVRLAGDAAEPQARLLQTRLTLAVENLPLFLEANKLTVTARHGEPDSCYEEARCPLPRGELAVVVRSGYRGFRPGALSPGLSWKLARARAAFRNRGREGEETRVLAEARTLAESAVGAIGQGRATDEFFAIEREYYATRNRAARWQYERQQRLGIGWANHDHHTYRSSRAAFHALTQLWHALGFLSRERFYAGAEAGWGAQILEHPLSRVVIFADVDMAPEELDIDYAATDLPSRDTLGTIGLWCALHGSSIAGAGMHHLEAEYDWARAKTLLEAAGIGVMAPFTDLPMLKQAFTQAETWPVAPGRIRALREDGRITAQQAEGFLGQGAPGSHLEILQRREGFKGFNKTGVSAILRETDARRSIAGA